jgi:hypothetical protein
MLQEGTNGTRNRYIKEQLRLGKERKPSVIYRMTIGLDVVKRAVGISSDLRRIRNRILWRGRPSPKRIKNLHIQQGLLM